MTPERAMRILNLEPDNYSPEARSILSRIAAIDDGPMDRSELLRRLGDFDALIVRFGMRIDRAVLDAGRRLKAVACAATGTDHIDVAHAKAKGIAVVSLAGETEFLRSIPASAEHAFALLLALMRRIPAAAEAARHGRWTRDAFRGRDLSGKTLGLVGCGRIGEKTARFAQAFGMRVVAYDPFRATLPDGVARAPTLAALMQEADAVMVLVPLKAETARMIDRAALDAAKPSAVLVNVSRGGVLDEEALLDALAARRLSGAALDVLSDETPEAVATSPLLAYARAHDNLIVTPHIAGATVESMAATEVFIARKLAQVLQQTPVPA